LVFSGRVKQGREIHTVTVDTGGFSDTELARIEKLARALGAESHTTINAREDCFAIIYASSWRVTSARRLVSTPVKCRAICQRAAS